MYPCIMNWQIYIQPEVVIFVIISTNKSVPFAQKTGKIF